jgi:cytidyltransferase-like protein
MKNIINLKDVLKIERKNLKVVFCSGAFDLLHHGHIIALKKASILGDILIVQIDGNKLVSKRKGKGRPILDEQYRAFLVSSMGFVDYIFISNKPSESIVTIIKPDVFVRAKLETENEEIRKMREEKLLKKVPSMKVVWLKQSSHVSTTKILARGGATKRHHVLAVTK